MWCFITEIQDEAVTFKTPLPSAPPPPEMHFEPVSSGVEARPADIRRDVDGKNISL